MEKRSDFFEKVMAATRKPIIPEKPKEEKFNQPIAFPDADATEEEIAEYINGGKETEE